MQTAGEGLTLERVDSKPDSRDIFSEWTINRVQFKNRLLRSSIGGRMSNYDGTVTDVWKNFEKRFATGGVSGIISTTFHVNADRLSPLQYPSIASDQHIPHLKKYIAEIKNVDRGCNYIVQIGDPGYTTYSSLFPEEVDSRSSSAGFDLGFGYNNTRTEMKVGEIEKAIRDHIDAAKRVQEAGADGVEITATKGYLIHQFLNPGINRRRRDHWGGNAANRFRFLEQIVTGVRQRVGLNYLLGVRLSASDLNYSPIALSLFRWPSPLLSKDARFGNEQNTMLGYAERLRKLDVDYVHVVNGFGFPNPADTPGSFPFDEVKIFFNSTRHLSLKAATRATVLNTIPAPAARWLLNFGWKYRAQVNLDSARFLKSHLADVKGGKPLTVICNGGFEEREDIEAALTGPDGCDMVSMARALIANPDLPNIYEKGQKIADRKKCTHCNRCVGRAATSPLGCYEESRFKNVRAMREQILEWNRPDPVESETITQACDREMAEQRSTSARVLEAL